MSSIPFEKAFEVLHNREGHYETIGSDEFPPRMMLAQVAVITLLIFAYGFIMGSYNSFLQASVAGVKLWLLLMLTLLICFPSFYIVQLILGSKIRIKQLAVILLSGFVMTTTVMIAFAPIVLFFQLSGDNYNFLQLLHVFVFIFSGFFGMRVVLESLKNAFDSANVYPKIGLSVFRIWVIIFAFVGIQLSWNLRPFLGTKEMPFELVRNDTRGNFYSTILGAVGQMLGGGIPRNKKAKEVPPANEIEKEQVEKETSPPPASPQDSLPEQ